MRLSIVVVCSGNAARSVMAGAALRVLLPDADIATAGTHVIEGQPMSRRTQLALEHVAHAAPGHRSRQLHAGHVADADLVIGLAPEHVRWIRVNHPDAAPRTATLRRLVRDLPGHDVGELALESVDLEDWEEVTDPAGGEQPDFDACAREVVGLIEELVAALRTPRPGSPTAARGNE